MDVVPPSVIHLLTKFSFKAEDVTSSIRAAAKEYFSNQVFKYFGFNYIGLDVILA